MTPLRIAVVGVGHMGRNHAKKVTELARETGEVRLAGVVDIDPERAEAAGRELGVKSSTRVEEIYAVADAAIVAVPTLEHVAVVGCALEAGLDVLVEKPIAASLEEGEKLLGDADERGLLLLVGHQEWFNAAMGVIRKHIREPRFVEAHRIGPFPERTADIDVVRDLMIHDIDILQRLLGETPVRIESVGVPVVTGQVDIANARITFPGGCIANLTASRVSVSPMRKLRFFQRDAYFSIDFLNQSAVMFRRLDGDGNGAPRIEMEELKIDREDALAKQLLAFVEVCRTRERDPDAGRDALWALRTALRVVEAMPPTEGLP